MRILSKSLIVESPPEKEKKNHKKTMTVNKAMHIVDTLKLSINWQSTRCLGEVKEIIR